MWLLAGSGLHVGDNSAWNRGVPKLQQGPQRIEGHLQGEVHILGKLKGRAKAQSSGPSSRLSVKGIEQLGDTVKESILAPLRPTTED